MPTVGLPQMHLEKGEKRAFLPGLVAHLHQLGASAIVIEQGCGSGMNVAPAEYQAAGPRVRFASYDESLAQDVVLTLRYPGDEVLHRLREGATMLSMFHYPTRPDRVALLQKLRLHAISLDSLTDDDGRRLVENLEAVAWNGCRIAFQVMAKKLPDFGSAARGPIRVTLIGAGAVGGHVVRAAAAYGDRELRRQLVAQGVPGVQTTVVDYDLTGSESYMRDLLAQTDLLVDATQRPDPSKCVIPNSWLAALPESAVLLDLSVDPYDFSRQPPATKGIEGLPPGTLDQIVIEPDDAIYETMDARIPTDNRRTAVSCYSWPGVYPKECMEVYGRQLEPLLEVLLAKGAADLDPHAPSAAERALARAEINQWVAAHAAG